MQTERLLSYTVVESSRVWTLFCSRRLTRCTVTTAPDDGTGHPQLQPALSSAGTDEWVLSWYLNEASDSSGDRRAVGSRFQVLGPYAYSKAALGRRRPSPGHQEDPGDCRATLSTTVRRHRRHTEVGQVTWRRVVPSLPYRHRRLKDNSLTNWKPMKCREDQRDVVMTTSAGDQTSCRILYRLQATEMDVGNAGKK